MEKRVKIPVSDEIYELIERCAKADGVTPDQWTEKALSQAYKSLKKKV
jgi:Leu/Phe-tRNA-protein transferase